MGQGVEEGRVGGVCGESGAAGDGVSVVGRRRRRGGEELETKQVVEGGVGGAGGGVREPGKLTGG